MNAYAEAKAQEEAAAAQKASEEAAIAAGEGTRDASGAYVPNPVNNGGGSSAGGGNSDGCGGGYTPPSTGGGGRVPVWHEHWIYFCNTCWARFESEAELDAHQNYYRDKVLNGEIPISETNGGYTAQDWGWYE